MDLKDGVLTVAYGKKADSFNLNKLTITPRNGKTIDFAKTPHDCVDGISFKSRLGVDHSVRAIQEGIIDSALYYFWFRDHPEWWTVTIRQEQQTKTTDMPSPA
jgi:hypothetical protein